MKTKLRIEMVEESGVKMVKLSAGDQERFYTHGFGTFMQDIQPGEVECSQEALDLLLSCHEQGGLNGLEFWKQNMLAWGSQSQILLIPIDEISVPGAAKSWIREFQVIVTGKNC